MKHGDLVGEGVVGRLPCGGGPSPPTPGVEGGAGHVQQPAQESNSGVVFSASMNAYIALTDRSPSRRRPRLFAASRSSLACSAVLLRSRLSSSRSALVSSPGAPSPRSALACAVPAAQGLGAHPEFPGDRGDRPARGVDERDRVPLELLGVPLRCTCFPPGATSSGTSRPSLQVSTIKGKLQFPLPRYQDRCRRTAGRRFHHRGTTGADELPAGGPDPSGIPAGSPRRRPANTVTSWEPRTPHGAASSSGRGNSVSRPQSSGKWPGRSCRPPGLGRR